MYVHTYVRMYTEDVSFVRKGKEKKSKENCCTYVYTYIMADNVMFNNLGKECMCVCEYLYNMCFFLYIDT